jgi:hypothetical protein
MYPNYSARRAKTTSAPGRKIWAEHGEASQSPLAIRERPLSNLKSRRFIFVSPLIFQTKVTLNRRDIATCDVHFSAKLVKSIGNITYRHITFSEI